MEVKTSPELRKFPRHEFRGRVELELGSSGRPTPQARLETNSLNVSEGGICLRLERTLDLHSRVLLRLFAQPRKPPLECAAQVAWVVQRLDLRDAPPFVYDIGLEFIDPSSRIRQVVLGLDAAPKSSGVRLSRRLLPSTIRGRSYVPQLQQESESEHRWHLVVTVDGTPCFSRRFASQREAFQAWERFKRNGAKAR